MYGLTQGLLSLVLWHLPSTLVTCLLKTVSWGCFPRWEIPSPPSSSPVCSVFVMVHFLSSGPPCIEHVWKLSRSPLGARASREHVLGKVVEPGATARKKMMCWFCSSPGASVLATPRSLVLPAWCRVYPMVLPTLSGRGAVEIVPLMAWKPTFASLSDF